MVKLQHLCPAVIRACWHYSWVAIQVVEKLHYLCPAVINVLTNHPIWLTSVLLQSSVVLVNIWLLTSGRWHPQSSSVFFRRRDHHSERVWREHTLPHWERRGLTTSVRECDQFTRSPIWEARSTASCFSYIESPPPRGGECLVFPALGCSNFHNNCEIIRFLGIENFPSQT